jgi:hypothetical protein
MQKKTQKATKKFFCESATIIFRVNKLLYGRYAGVGKHFEKYFKKNFKDLGQREW